MRAPRSPAAVFLLTSACQSTLSNDVFVQDGRFLAALPSEESAAAPAIYGTLGDPGDVPLRAAEAGAAADLETAPLRSLGAVLRATLPAERSAVHRRWLEVPYVLDTKDGALQAWLDAEILHTPTGEMVWSASIRTEPGQPSLLVAEGTHWSLEEDPSTWDGEYRWDPALLADELPSIPPQVIEVHYAHGPEGRLAELQVRPEALAAPTEEFRFFGEHGLVFAAVFTLGGEVVAGFAAADHTVSEGGRADGSFGSKSQPFSVCWSATGSETYVGPETLTGAFGSETDCAYSEVIPP